MSIHSSFALPLVLAFLFVAPAATFADTVAFDAQGKDLTFGTSGTQRMVILSTNGNVGIGTPAPTAKLDVNGSANIVGNVKISGIDVPCDTAHAGTIRWFNQVFQGCTGTRWASLGINDTVQVTAPVQSCGKINNDTISVATCPNGYTLTGGGYSITLWNPGSGDTTNSPDSSAPSGNTWIVDAGGKSAYSCFVAYAVCAR